jgi:hypothetical protein
LQVEIKPSWVGDGPAGAVVVVDVLEVVVVDVLDVVVVLGVVVGAAP